MNTQLTLINVFKNCWLALLVGVLTAAVPASALAQSTGGRISGTITDQAGAILPNATVTVTSEDRGAKRHATTDVNGFYAVPELRVGFYTIKVEGNGFAPATRTRVKVDVGAETRLDISLMVQVTNATVDVRAEAPLLQLIPAGQLQPASRTRCVELRQSSSLHGEFHVRTGLPSEQAGQLARKTD